MFLKTKLKVPSYSLPYQKSPLPFHEAYHEGNYINPFLRTNDLSRKGSPKSPGWNVTFSFPLPRKSLLQVGEAKRDLSSYLSEAVSV